MEVKVCKNCQRINLLENKVCVSCGGDDFDGLVLYSLLEESI